MTVAAKTFNFKSRDGRRFKVPEKAAYLCSVVHDMIKTLEWTDESEILVANASSDVLAKVIEWLLHHQDNPNVNIVDAEDRDSMNVPEWDKNFLNVSQFILYEIILVATYLDIKGLMDYCCKMVAQTFKGKTPEELRATFGAPADFGEGEEEQIRRENAWCVD